MTADTLVQPTLRIARLEDFSQIEQLEKAHGLLSLSEHDWRSISLDHPLRESLERINFPIGWVLENDKHEIVGAMANIATQYVLGDRTLLAATGRGWVVAPEYRAVALWLMDEYFNQSNVDLFINTTVNSLAVDAFGVFGSTRVPLGDWTRAAFRITNFLGFAKAAARIKKLPLQSLAALPIAAALRVREWTRFSGFNFTREPIRADSKFDERFDLFWAALRNKYPKKLLSVRDRATLEWHFASALRANELWAYSIEQEGTMRAYAIAKRHDHPPSGLTRVRLVDFQSLDGDETSDAQQHSLVRAMADRCVAERIHVFEHVGCALPKMKVFDAFAHDRRDLPAWPFYFKAADERLHVRLNDSALWDASAYDGDASL